ncbi:hypothetical protein IWQ61_000474 [Dispira simplex]|nr:hypothetical protein IWQ61_000474 [Dispira simplex]
MLAVMKSNNLQHAHDVGAKTTKKASLHKGYTRIICRLFSKTTSAVTSSMKPFTWPKKYTTTFKPAPDASSKTPQS